MRTSDVADIAFRNTQARAHNWFGSPSMKEARQVCTGNLPPTNQRGHVGSLAATAYGHVLF